MDRPSYERGQYLGHAQWAVVQMLLLAKAPALLDRLAGLLGTLVGGVGRKSVAIAALKNLHDTCKGLQLQRKLQPGESMPPLMR
jgi:hypothetical protein